MAPEAALRVEPPGVGVLEPLHPGNQVRLRGAEDRVAVVVHENPREDLPTGSAAGFAEGVEEQKAISFVVDNGFTAIAAGHEVVDGILVLGAGGVAFRASEGVCASVEKCCRPPHLNHALLARSLNSNSGPSGPALHRTVGAVR